MLCGGERMQSRQATIFFGERGTLSSGRNNSPLRKCAPLKRRGSQISCVFYLLIRRSAGGIGHGSRCFWPSILHFIELPAKNAATIYTNQFYNERSVTP